ncbi:MAG: site-specific integrase [Alphaproteobacteria bacterium]|nr:site-specific integrase [Alphaproteobacteria bacterium]
MFKKCQSKCQADKHLWIRNSVFYYMVELPNENGKRRYFVKSLHTTNYYEAQEKAKIMLETLNKKDYEAKAYVLAAKIIMQKLVFDKDTKSDGTEVIRISSKNDPTVLKSAFEIVAKELDLSTLPKADQEFMQTFAKMVGDYLISIGAIPQPKSNPNSNHTIKEIMESMLKKAGNVKSVEQNRRTLITKMIQNVGLNIDDKYSKFYQPDIIQKMCDNITAMNVTGTVKRNHAREIKNLITHANYIDPDTYKTNLLNLIPEFKKTRKTERNPHWPYTNDELKQIFDPSNDYFNENPDMFWSVMVGLFLGARTNAAITLQYADIVNIDGIDCLKFQDTHPIKQLKNDASRRTVPIPKQLLDMGFVTYFQNQKIKIKAKDTDFIIPHCQTESGEYNNKFMTRGFIQYIKDIGITANNPHKLDFHSLRKNANQRLEEAGVFETFINDIIGWEGKSTRQQSYSNHDLIKIKEQADKLRYDFLQPEFDYWRDVMSKK